MPRSLLLAASLLLFIASCEKKEEPEAIGSGGALVSAGTPSKLPEGARSLTYEGRDVCAACHVEQTALYRGSDHDRALELPSETSIGAPFSGEILRGKFLEAAFQGGKAHPEISITEGETQTTYSVLWSMGHAPLQQYLVRTSNGRIQAFSGAYDTGAGKGSWYFLPEADVPQGDDLHFLGEGYNYNYMCADCHSTHVEKNYDLETDSYNTTFKEIDVSCEACHGPGSEHVSLKRAKAKSSGFLKGLPKARAWVRAKGARIAHREPAQSIVEAASERRSLGSEIDTCAPCHARRSDLGPAEKAGFTEEFFSDRYRLSTLSSDLYFDDGQIREEVYVTGSFLQSKMYGAGVVCSDCHDPHSAKLKKPLQETCSGCHDAEYYDSKRHHLHAIPETAVGKSVDRNAQPLCVDCHAPQTVYMGVDARRDHRFSVPRPDLSLEFNVPNPCSSCHQMSNSRAADLIAETHGPVRAPHFAEAFGRAAKGEVDAERGLARVFADVSQAPLVRASALTRWSELEQPGQDLLQALEAAARSESPMLRLAAADAVGQLPVPLRANLLAPLWDDPTRSVRIAAAESSIGLPAVLVKQTPALARALKEAEVSSRYNSDRIEGLLALASITEFQGNWGGAKRYYELALKRFAEHPEAVANYADALRRQGAEAEAGDVLLAGTKTVPHSPELRHAYGLWLVRAQRRKEAIVWLREAYERARDAQKSEFAYVYLLALMTETNRSVWEAERSQVVRLLPRPRSVEQLSYQAH